MQVVTENNRSIGQAVAELKNRKIDITDKASIAQVASISGNDTEIGAMIAEALDSYLIREGYIP